MPLAPFVEGALGEWYGLAGEVKSRAQKRRVINLSCADLWIYRITICRRGCYSVSRRAPIEADLPRLFSSTTHTEPGSSLHLPNMVGNDPVSAGQGHDLPHFPDKGCKFTRYSGADHGKSPTSDGELAVTTAQSYLRAPSNIARIFLGGAEDRFFLTCDSGRESVAPGALNEDPTNLAISRSGQSCSLDALTAGMFRRHQTEVSPKLRRRGKAPEVTGYRQNNCRRNQINALHQAKRVHERLHRPVRKQVSDLPD